MPERGIGGRPRVSAKIARALAPIRDEGLGHRAQIVLSLHIAISVAEAAPIVRFHMRDAEGSAANLDLVSRCGGARARLDV